MNELIGLFMTEVRLGNVDNMWISYFYLLLFWSNGDGIMWEFVGKDENCVQRG